MSIILMNLCYKTIFMALYYGISVYELNSLNLKNKYVTIKKKK